MQGDKVFASVSIDTPAAQTGGRESVALRSGQPVPSSALDLIKKKLLPETGSPITSPHSTSGPTASDTNGLKAVESVVKGQKPVISKEKAKDAADDGNMSDSSSESDDEESGPSKEECIIKFKVILLLMIYDFIVAQFLEINHFWTSNFEMHMELHLIGILVTWAWKMSF